MDFIFFRNLSTSVRYLKCIPFYACHDRDGQQVLIRSGKAGHLLFKMGVQNNVRFDYFF